MRVSTSLPVFVLPADSVLDSLHRLQEALGALGVCAVARPGPARDVAVLAHGELGVAAIVAGLVCRRGGVRVGQGVAEGLRFGARQVRPRGRVRAGAPVADPVKGASDFARRGVPQVRGVDACLAIPRFSVLALCALSGSSFSGRSRPNRNAPNPTKEGLYAGKPRFVWSAVQTIPRGFLPGLQLPAISLRTTGCGCPAQSPRPEGAARSGWTRCPCRTRAVRGPARGEGSPPGGRTPAACRPSRHL